MLRFTSNPRGLTSLLAVKRLLLVSLLLVSAGAYAENNVVLLSDSQGFGFPHALKTAIANNPTIRGKNAELQAQAYAVDAARATRYPSLNVSANNTNDQFGDQGTIRIEQPLWTFGKIRTTINEQKALYQAELWDLLRVQRELIENTGVAYARVDGVRQRRAVARLNTSEQESLYQRIERRQEGQLASEADVRIANSRLIQARALEQRVTGEMRVALAELRALTQVDVNVSEPVDPAIVNTPDDIVAVAVERSAEIAQKKIEVQALEVTIERERKERMPSVVLRAERDFLDQQQFTDPDRIGVAIVSDLQGMGLVNQGRIKSAIARVDAARADVSVTQLDVERRVTVLMENRDVTAELIESQRDAVAAVEATLESFVRQYETGRKSWVEVLNTQRELTSLRLELAQLENDLLVLSLRLAAVAGQLDQHAGIEPPLS